MESTEAEKNYGIATNILMQLGGRMFIRMTGSNRFVSLEQGIGMKLVKNASKANYLRIKLTPADEYDIDFIKVGKNKMEFIERFTGTHRDQLQDVFTGVTGFFTKL